MCAIDAARLQMRGKFIARQRIVAADRQRVHPVDVERPVLLGGQLEARNAGQRLRISPRDAALLLDDLIDLLELRAPKAAWMPVIRKLKPARSCQ